MFGKDMILKTVATMLKTHLDKSNDGKLIVSLSDIKKYISDNYKEFNANYVVQENDVKIVFEKKNK